MIVVADASTLVGELLRKRGRYLILDDALRVLVTEHQWSETEHELRRRLDILVERGAITTERRAELETDVLSFVKVGAIQIIEASAYEDLEALARDRVPRDPNDWPTVALAISLSVGILTGDNDFLGCGCPTWTVETLTRELSR